MAMGMTTGQLVHVTTDQSRDAAIACYTDQIIAAMIMTAHT